MNNDYYVYIYWRLDTNEPFYVGKGKGDRWRILHDRGNHFKNIINKSSVLCEIVKDNLVEQEAFYWEEEIIRILVFEYGFSIDIPGNRSNNEKHYHLVNATWGGEGCHGYVPSDETRRKISKANMGHEVLKETRNKISKAHTGMRHTDETRRKISESLKGENNPNYGVHRYGEDNPMYGKTHTEETIKKMKKAKEGKNNPKAKSVICLTTKKIFLTMKEGANFYNLTSSNIGVCCKGKQKYAGKLENNIKLVWMFLDEFLEKCNYIIL